MGKKIKTIIYTILLIALIAIAGWLFFVKLYEFLIVDISILVIILILLLLNIVEKTDDVSIYNNELKKMLKRYDTILVETSTIPDLQDKNVMIITNIEDMIDAAVEIRKPIYYKKENRFLKQMRTNISSNNEPVFRCYNYLNYNYSH